jgi:hypothetical protein
MAGPLQPGAFELGRPQTSRCRLPLVPNCLGRVCMPRSCLVLVALLCVKSACAQVQPAFQFPGCDPPLVCMPQPSPEPARNSQTVVFASKSARPEMFSELTLFLFGSGLALLVALLGWSDQIRGINKDTREMEHKFLGTTKVDRRVFLSVVKPASPDEQLAALTEILTSGKLKTVAAVEVLQIFQTWHRNWTTLERLSVWKYRLSVILTYALFAAGVLSLFVDPHAEVPVLHFHIRAILLILLIPMGGFLAILTIITVANYREAYFHELLTSLSDKV